MNIVLKLIFYSEGQLSRISVVPMKILRKEYCARFLHFIFVYFPLCKDPSTSIKIEIINNTKLLPPMIEHFRSKFGLLHI